MHRERKLAALRRALSDHGYVRGDEATFFCKNPQGCAGGHHKRKLNVNLQSDIFHCWVCNWSGGRLTKIFRALLPASDQDRIDYESEQARPKEVKERQYDAVHLPGEFRPLCHPFPGLQYRQAIAYLGRRGITSDDILTYKLGFCMEGRYADRIIIPSFDEDGELNFFVGRSIWNRAGDFPYLSGKFDKDIIFNDLLVCWGQDITLVEGPFDAFKAGTNAIPLQGKYPSKKLLDKIISTKVRVKIALDSDALGDALKIAEQLMKYGVDVSIVSWPKELKDPGDMTREQFNEFSQRARPINSPVDVIRVRAQYSGTL